MEWVSLSFLHAMLIVTLPAINLLECMGPCIFGLPWLVRPTLNFMFLIVLMYNLSHYCYLQLFTLSLISLGPVLLDFVFSSVQLDLVQFNLVVSSNSFRSVELCSVQKNRASIINDIIRILFEFVEICFYIIKCKMLMIVGNNTN